MLVGEHAVQHQEFLTAGVYMCREVAAGRIAHDGGGASDLIADPVQHAPVDAIHRRRHPVGLCAMNACALVEIRIEFHCRGLPSVHVRYSHNIYYGI